MIGILVFTIGLLVVGLVATAYLLGFRLGGASWQEELARVRGESRAAQRHIEALTRQAFVAMAEEVERRDRP